MTDPNERLNNAADIVRSVQGHSPVSGTHIVHPPPYNFAIWARFQAD